MQGAFPQSAIRNPQSEIADSRVRVVVEVAHSADVGEARRRAKSMAVSLGFDETDGEEVALAVSELAGNLVKHAGGGTLTLTPLSEGERVGIQIESLDHGPGIDDVERAIADGFSTRGSLGCGLGAVNRLMDKLDIVSEQGKGTQIVCERWGRPSPGNTGRCPLEFGVAARSHPRMQVNGDAFVIRQWEDKALVGVIDGLGHGQFAHRAAQTARQYVESHFDQSLEVIFRGVGRACRSTRGVVMALARFDFGFGIASRRIGTSSAFRDCGLEKLPLNVSGIRLTFASVGNIEARVLVNPQSETRNPKSAMNFIVRRGIIGVNAPNPVVTEHNWEPSSVMVLHSDGLTTHWREDDFRKVMKESATVVAQRLLRALAKEEDDATVVVVKGKGEGRT